MWYAKATCEAPMSKASKPHNLIQMLDRLQNNISDTERVTVDAMLDAVGRRSFGPILLLAGLIPASPLSGVPGIPTFTAIAIFPIIVQLLMGRNQFWLPRWVLERSVDQVKFTKALNSIRRPARWIDRLIHPRLEFLTEGISVYCVSILCLFIVLMMPPLELTPFANSLSGAALALFGLALISHDGLLVLIGFTLCAATAGLAVSALL